MMNFHLRNLILWTAQFFFDSKEQMERLKAARSGTPATFKDQQQCNACITQLSFNTAWQLCRQYCVPRIVIKMLSYATTRLVAGFSLISRKFVNVVTLYKIFQ